MSTIWIRVVGTTFFYLSSAFFSPFLRENVFQPYINSRRVFYKIQETYSAHPMEIKKAPKSLLNLLGFYNYIIYFPPIGKDFS